MAAPHRPALLLVAGGEGAGIKAGLGGGRGAAALETRLLRQAGESKMAAAEEDCGAGADADRELEELLESKSSLWERPDGGGCKDSFEGKLNLRYWGRSGGGSPKCWPGADGLPATPRKICRSRSASSAAGAREPPWAPEPVRPLVSGPEGKR